MQVKEIFELRKQGRIEEAYDAIRPLYATHKGKYTTLCMFWTAADIFKLRMDQGRVDEARKIFEALKRVLPYIKNNEQRPEANDAIPALGIDKDSRSTTETAASFIQYASRRLQKATQDSNNSLPKQTQGNKNSDNSRNSCSSKVAATQGDNNSDNSKDSCSSKEDSMTKSQPKEAIIHHTSNILHHTSEPTPHLAVSLDEGIIRPLPGISAPQRVVLACIVAHPGYDITQISDSTGIPQSSVERHIAVLVDRNLINQDPKQSGFSVK